MNDSPIVVVTFVIVMCMIGLYRAAHVVADWPVPPAGDRRGHLDKR